jgi:hypothetical protein
MVASLKHRERFQDLQEIGCLCCLIAGYGYRAPDMHHVVDCGTREASGGHDSTIPLCEWMHRGLPFSGYQVSEMRELFGPSLALEKRAFVERYGNERKLLAITDAIIRIVQSARRRGEFLPAREIGKAVRELHREIVGEKA